MLRLCSWLLRWFVILVKGKVDKQTECDSKPEPMAVDPTTSMEDQLNIFRAEDMLIYEYFDGQSQVKVDPMVLIKRWAEREKEITVELQAASTPGFDKADESYIAAVRKIREIFELKPYAEGGITEIEVLNLYYHFTLFFYNIKKNSSGSRTSSQTMESASQK